MPDEVVEVSSTLRVIRIKIGKSLNYIFLAEIVVHRRRLLGNALCRRFDVRTYVPIYVSLYCDISCYGLKMSAIAACSEKSNYSNSEVLSEFACLLVLL